MAVRRLPHADGAFLARLRKEPKAVVQHIQDLYEGRVKGSRNHELFVQLDQLQVALYHPRELSDRTWYALMKGCGLAEMYVRFVLGDGFFEEDPTFTMAVFIGLGHIANGASEVRDTETQSFLTARCSKLFKTVWDNHKLLQRISHEETPSEDYGHPVIVCMMYFSQLYFAVHRKGAGPSTYIPQVALFGWLKLHDKRYSMSGLLWLTEEESPPAAELDRLVQDALVDVIGVAVLFEHLEQMLRSQTTRTIIQYLIMAVKLIPHAALHPPMQKLKTFKRVVERQSRMVAQSRQPGFNDNGMGWNEWQVSLLFFGAMIVDLYEAVKKEDMSSVTFDGADAITFLAQGTFWIAQIASQGRHAQVPDLARKCNEIADALNAFYEDVASPIWRTTAPRFVAGVLRGMRIESAPTLEALRAGNYRLGALTAPYSKLLNQWTLFSGALASHEDWEKAEARKFCSYRQCPFNVQPPTGALFACKGCGEVRYCGKSCQLSDWKAEHKQVCGKRVKEPVTPWMDQLFDLD